MIPGQASARFSLFNTAIGKCGIAWQGELVVATQLPERDAVETAQQLAARTGAVEDEPPVHVQTTVAAIRRLLDGVSTDLQNVACDFSRSNSFATDVYSIARSIPYGETRTYGEIAIELGNRLYAQQVGQALGRNPLPIIVPCHRVLGANHRLTGFSAHGGIETKRKMLAIEGTLMAQTRDLFD